MSKNRTESKGGEVGTKKKGFSAEQIIGKLREAEVLLIQGSTVGEVNCKLSVTEQTYYRCRQYYGGGSEQKGM
jgi:putative transposase